MIIKQSNQLFYLYEIITVCKAMDMLCFIEISILPVTNLTNKINYKTEHGHCFTYSDDFIRPNLQILNISILNSPSNPKKIIWFVEHDNISFSFDVHNINFFCNRIIKIVRYIHVLLLLVFIIYSFYHLKCLHLSLCLKFFKLLFVCSRP